MHQDTSAAGRRARLLASSLIGTFVIMRTAMFVRPDADFDVFGYNIHHLFTGVLIITACSVPLVIGGLTARWRERLIIGFGIGLGLVLDEWVYLIATDGSNASYLLPVSLWGGVAMVTGAAVYTATAVWLLKRIRSRDRVDS